jgi:hypothetical protein
MPEEIQTSMCINNTDFRVVIRCPFIEYHIPSQNFLFLKTLTREEGRLFFKAMFAEWHTSSIQLLMK